MLAPGDTCLQLAQPFPLRNDTPKKMGLQLSPPAHRESHGFVHHLKPGVEQKQERGRGGRFREGFHDKQGKRAEIPPQP